MRWPVLLIIAFSLGVGSVARADDDDIDERARQLDRERSYKVRLSAALWLAKKKDARAVVAMTKALEEDTEADIREIAAKALLRMLSSRTPADVRSKAFAALQRAASNDEDKTVRRRAKRALRKLADLRAATPTESQTVATNGKRPSSIYIYIGKPALGKHKTPKGTGVAIERAVTGQLQSKLPKRYFKLGASSATLPTQAELQRNNIRGWFVGASITELKVTRKGNIAEIRCTLNMRVNPWFGKDTQERLTANDTASAKGSATVKGANTKREIGYAKRDCLVAVAEQLTANRLAPFLTERNPRKRRRSATRPHGGGGLGSTAWTRLHAR